MFTLTSRVPELPVPLIVPVPSGPVVPVAPSTIFSGSSVKAPPFQPVAARVSILEFSERTSGALTSTFPPFPPLAPPVAVIRLPALSRNVPPDLIVMFPPGLVPSGPPLAWSTEDPVN